MRSRLKLLNHLRRTVIAVLLLALLASACGSNDFSAVTDAAGDAAEQSFDAVDSGDDAMFEVAISEEAMEFEEAMDEEAMDDFASGSDGQELRATTTGSTGSQPQAQLPDLGRDIIYTADLELASTDVFTATRDAVQTIEGLGGFVFSQRTDGRTNTSTLVFKIFPEQFQTALERLGSVGRVLRQDVAAEDVTAIVVDLKSRITTSEASVIRLRDLLEDANDIEIIASLENQLLQRETSLEQLRGQLRSLQSRVDLATINVTFTTLVNRPSLAIELGAHNGHDATIDCVLGSLGSARLRTSGPTTICYRLINTGDATLTDIEVADTSIGLTTNEVIVLDGSLDRLEPGEMVVVAFETTVEETVAIRTTATATALDDDGVALAERLTANASPIRITPIVVDDGTGFGDVFSGSLNAIASIALFVALAAVAIAPFLVVGAILWLVALVIWRAAGRPNLRRSPRKATPPPPPPAAAPVNEPAMADATSGPTETTVSD